MTLYDILLPYQKAFVEAKQKSKLFLSARQIGKSFTLAYLAAQKVLMSRRGKEALALVISTGSRAASEFLKKCQQMAESVHILEPSIEYVSTADTVKFSSGQRIVSLPSGNPAALRGYTADMIVLDECAYIERPDEVWAAIAPTLTRNPDAELVLASTPAGKASWFYDKVQEAKADPSNWYFQQTTIEDAVAQGLKLDLAALRKTISDPDTWSREYMCKFAADFSSLVDTSILDFYDEAPAFKAKYLGMDVGSTSDRTAIVTLGESGGVYYVDDIAIMHKAEYTTQVDVVKQMHEQHHYCSGYIDQTGIGSALAEFIAKNVSTRLKGMTFTASNKTPCYEDLRSKIFDHKLKFNKKLKELIVDDFNNVHRVVSEAGRVSYEAGRNANGHSDATSALVLALRAVHDNGCQLSMPTSWAFPSKFK